MTLSQRVQFLAGIFIGIPLLAYGILNSEGISLLLGTLLVGLLVLTVREAR